MKPMTRRDAPGTPEKPTGPASSTRAVRAEYDRLAARYDRKWSRYTEASVRQTLRHVTLRPGDRVLDLGCGTGVLLAELRRRSTDAVLVGVDLSPPMLEAARRRLGEGSRLAAADVERLPFPAAHFDVVVSTSSFHFWSSPESGLREIGRVLRPGGYVVITDWCDDYLACLVCDYLLRLMSPAHRRSYGMRECQAFLEACDYRVRSLERYKIDWLWGLMTASAVYPARRHTDPTPIEDPHP